MGGLALDREFRKGLTTKGGDDTVVLILHKGWEGPFTRLLERTHGREGMGKGPGKALRGDGTWPDSEES